ncbi:MAG: polysaccharide biosynthesis tyrosine autokinase [Ignavibacteriaceae bacterium]
MMENFNNGYPDTETKNLRDYLNLIRNNIVPMVIITLTCIIVAVVYALNSTDVYTATTTLKISKPQGSILNSPMIPEFQDWGNDRFVANELEIMKSYSVREKVAKALYDSVGNDGKEVSAIFRKESEFTLKNEDVLSVRMVANMLLSFIDVEQKRGLDIVEISVESPSPEGAALMANTFANEYRNLNLDQNRNQLTLVKNFLKEQRLEKLNELKDAEELLSSYQQKGGIIALDEQASTLISTLSDFEAQKNAAQIELSASNRVLNQFKSELENQNPKMVDYLESVSSEAYFKSLQNELAKQELNRDLALANIKGPENSQVLKEYDQRIKDLRKKLEEKLEVIKAGIFASSPEEVKELSQKIINEEVRNQSLRTTLAELSVIVDQYDARFNRLPKTAIDLARLQRSRESLEKLYLLVEAKYQEALINEQSQPGNVIIIDSAIIPEFPSKPNRYLIIIIGIVLGGLLAYGYVFVKDYFDNTIKTPEDIEKNNLDVLAWIPKISGIGEKEGGSGFIVSKKFDSIPAEAFRALRTRIQFSRPDAKSLKVILVTSSIPQEGKTTVSVNLAGSFAQDNKRTLIIDCDLRKPKVHTLFNSTRYPGLIDYLFGQVTFEDILNQSEVNNLYFITSGTLPPNPAEMLNSEQAKSFIKDIREKFDIIIIDSPPVIAAADAEIISKYVDATVLVVSADKTELDLINKSVKIIKNDNSPFIGCVLNNFEYKNGYGNYYKYYYYYHSGDQPLNGKAKQRAERTS